MSGIFTLAPLILTLIPKLQIDALISISIVIFFVNHDPVDLPPQLINLLLDITHVLPVALVLPLLITLFV